MRRKLFLAIVCCIVILPLGLFLYLHLPFPPKGKPVLIAESSAPDGIEMCLTQTHNGLLEGFLEPYYISFFYRKNDTERWKWCYMDHEDTYWWSGSILVDPKASKARIVRGTKEVAVFDWEANTLTFDSDRGVVATPEAEITGNPLDPGQ